MAYSVQLERFERLWLADRGRYENFPTWDDAVARFDGLLAEPPTPLTESERLLRELGVA